MKIKSVVNTVLISFVLALLPTQVSALSADPQISPDYSQGYERKLFGIDWIDADKNGCNTRSEVLIAEAVVKLRGPMDGHLTQQWETAILRMLKKKGADLSNEKIAGKFDGYSEAWTKATFPVDSIKELMRLTDEFEEGIGIRGNAL